MGETNVLKAKMAQTLHTWGEKLNNLSTAWTIHSLAFQGWHPAATEEQPLHGGADFHSLLKFLPLSFASMQWYPFKIWLWARVGKLWYKTDPLFLGLSLHGVSHSPSGAGAAAWEELPVMIFRELTSVSSIQHSDKTHGNILISFNCVLINNWFAGEIMYWLEIQGTYPRPMFSYPHQSSLELYTFSFSFARFAILHLLFDICATRTDMNRILLP